MKYDHFRQERHDRWEELWVYRPTVDGRINLPLYVLHAGIGVWKARAAYQRTLSNVFSIELVTHGFVELEQDGHTRTIGAGGVYLLHRGVRHRYRAVGDGTMLKRYVALEGPILDHLLHLLGLKDRHAIALLSAESVRSRFRHLLRLVAGSDPWKGQDAAVAAYDLLQHIAGSIRFRYPEPVEDAVSYMYAHLDRSVTVTEIAAVVGLSPPHLNRLFNRYLHTSPIRYFISQKLTWAAHLIQHTTLSIKEIAFRIGFSDPLYFSAQFKKHFGSSPSQFRSIHETSSGPMHRAN